MKTSTLLITLTLLGAATLGAGCIENMRDLKDRVSGPDEPVQPAALVDTPPDVTNDDVPAEKTMKPPVARISVYGASGALEYQAGFLGDDVTTPIFLAAASKLTLNGAESTTLEAGATLTTYTWAFTGQTLTGLQTTAAMPKDAGLYPLVLTVTDSNGKSDSQAIVLGVAALPFDVVTSLKTPALNGAQVEGQQVGEPVDLAFTIENAIDGKTVKTLSTRIVLEPGASCDADMEVFDSQGASLGKAEAASMGDFAQTETLVLETLAAGAYTIRVTPFTCANQDGAPVTVTATYQQVVDGLADAHAGH